MKYIYFNQKYFFDKPKYANDGDVLFIPEPWLFYNNKIIKFLSHLHLSPKINSRINLPFKSFWIKRILKNSFSSNTDICIIINSHFYHLYKGGIISIAKNYFKNAKFVFIFSDKVEYFKKNYKDFPSIDVLKSNFDLVITYNLSDVEKYGLVLDRPVLPEYEKINSNLFGLKSDVFFVGGNKGRLKEIYEIFDICQKNNLVCDFHINGVPEQLQKHSDQIVYNKFISYAEVLERAKRSNCILNIIQDDGAGITLRDYESIYFNKYLLTNNYALKKIKVCSDEQIIWLDQILSKINDIKNGYHKQNNYVHMYTLKNWCNWIEKETK